MKVRMFESILGNDPIKTMLKQAINYNKVSHSYLMIGISGIGKKMIATEFAKAILCMGEEKICNHCKSCIEFDSNNNPDFLSIEPEGNSIKIEQIRELQKKIQEKPIISNKKVYIIEDADSMTKEAQNCLLKTLEEPPEFATIILIGSNENEFLATIKSRCMMLYFNPIEDTDIRMYLKEKYQMDNISQNMLDIFQGSIGKAITLKDKQEQYSQLESLINNLKQKDLIDILQGAEILYKAKDEIYEILDYINILLLKKARVNGEYTTCIKYVENTKKRLQKNANYDMCIDNMLFNMWEQVV
jgi:DNA polymerase-3 subunit delta'